MKEEKKKVLAARGAKDHISSHLSHSYRGKGEREGERDGSFLWTDILSLP